MSDREPVSPMQAIVDAIGKEHEKKRSATQLTLGGLIDLLKATKPARSIKGLGEEASYRGYYSDLAFETSSNAEHVSTLLSRCEKAMGRVYEGYKGGDNVMHQNTPLWVSDYGTASGVKLMGLDQSKAPIELVTEEEQW